MSKFDTNTTSYCIPCDYYHAFGFCPLCDGDKLIKKERKIIEYRVLYPEYACGQEIISLHHKVKIMLAEGWELYGFPFDSETLVHQAMVKYDR